MNNFYVYVHKKASNGEIFYVGKGQRSRHLATRRSAHWQNIVNKHGFTAQKLFINLSEQEAFEAEMFLINEIGRKDLNKGNLINLTDGGEGHVNLSPQIAKKKSQAMIGKKNALGCKHTDEMRKLKGLKRIGAKHSEETKKKLSLRKIGNKNRIGMKHSEETKKKMSDARKNYYAIKKLNATTIEGHLI